ncbi:B9 domain-containing protein 1 [Phlyctochytrium planicorne]|nr:B9 domain-containing protein 1 [Phlyctochytrium planicorne]
MSSFFSLVADGQIESALFPGQDNIYCKFSFVYGPDWNVVSGLEEGLTQLAKAPTSSTFGEAAYATGNYARTCVWNFPVDISFKSTNPYGWPQLIVSVYGLDELGRDVVRGYGSLRLPITSGKHTLYVHTFVPLATSPINQFLSWMSGRLPEFMDSTFVAKNSGREVTRVKSQGAVKVQLNISTKGFERFGLQNSVGGSKKLNKGSVSMAA